MSIGWVLQRVHKLGRACGQRLVSATLQAPCKHAPQALTLLCLGRSSSPLFINSCIMLQGLHSKVSPLPSQRRGARQGPSRPLKPPQASFFSQLFQRKENASDTNSFKEVPAYRPNDMIELAPGVKISPMGLGTW